MDLNEIPLLSMLRGRLGYLSRRQNLIAENVANADTPGYTPRDLKPFTVETGSATGGPGSVSMAVTQPGHMLPPHSPTSGASKPVDSRDSETRLDGNSVVLEEQMNKMTDARMNFEAAISFYQKSLSLLQTAARAPGQS